MINVVIQEIENMSKNKKRVTENSTTVEKPKPIPAPTPFIKQPSGELRENVKGNDFISWFRRLLQAFKKECSE